MARRLTRAQDGRPVAPVRIVHVGLGNFFRAHQAWYTDVAADAADWGIAAFAGRSLGVAADMQEQEGLYTLIVQHASGNEYQVISSISATHGGTDVAQLLAYFRTPELAIVTSTVTEAGYVRNEAGGLDADNEGVRADVAAITAGDLEAVRTAPGKFVAGLVARREAGSGALTFCPCDNIPENGEMAERVIRDMAALCDPSLDSWIDANVGFATTMVDRITPRPTDENRQALLDDQGIDDPAAVATEPFIEWVVSGDFKAGRPQWETGGAQFVDDVVPHELRKLWLLNGSHSLMAYAATILGKETVYEGISDPEVSGWVNEWWDVAQAELPLEEKVVADYRAALLERFGNPRMKDQLARIAADGSQKIPIRIVPALNAQRAKGLAPVGAERAVAAWTLHLRGLGAPVQDAKADVVTPLGEGTLEESVEKVADYLGIASADARASILALARELAAKAV